MPVLFVCSALLLLFSALALLALPTMAQQSMATDEKHGVWKAKKEEHREEHEWPEDIVLTGERTGFGSSGCVWVGQTRQRQRAMACRQANVRIPNKHAHTHTLSLSLSLTHIHTDHTLIHTNTHTRREKGVVHFAQY